MKISRVYIYLKFKNLFLSLFLNNNLSKKNVSKKLLEMTNKNILNFLVCVEQVLL